MQSGSSTVTSRVSTGEQVVLLYALATYLPQFVHHVINEEALGTRFRIGDGTQALAAFIPICLFVVFFIHRALPRLAVDSNPFGRLVARVFESPFNLIFGLLVLGLAAHFKVTQGISFRHSGDLLSRAGLSVAVLMFCKTYIFGWVIYAYLVAIKGLGRNVLRTKIEALIFSVALLLSLTGSLDVVPILWLMGLVVVSPRMLRRLFVASERRLRLIVRVALLVVGLPAAVAVALLMVWIGYINKMGIDGTAELVRRVGVGAVAEQVMVRTSSSYAAALSFAENNLYNASLYGQAIRIPFENVAYRVSLVVGDPVQRPEVTQITRLNYLNYERDPILPRAGASPGLVASAFYAGPFPIGFVLIGLYATFLIRIIDLALSDLRGKPKLAMTLFVATSVYTAFESPLDYLIVIDPAFAHFVMIVLGLVAAAAVRVRQTNPTHAARPYRRSALHVAS
jgi:hypothetical protein